jgi:acetylornithine deacetylase/succinyl-diaminopimelate desuccinylase-like protein
MTNLNRSIKYFHDHVDDFQSSLNELLEIQSISTDPDKKADIQEGAEWIASDLIRMGMENVKILPTKGHPIVKGEYTGAGRDRPTMLVYGHYDVQPVDPIDLWTSDPFKPVIRGDCLYARGASDMKGQIIASLRAIESVQHAGSLPVNLKFLFEGEEEIGSPNMEAFLLEHAGEFKADFALNPDSGMIGKDSPTIVYGLRGLAYFEVRLYGQKADLHSGVYGGIVQNPATTLCQLIAGMKDMGDHVLLPGFYDRVRPLDEKERKELARLPLDEAYFMKQAGTHKLFGEKGYSPIERVGGRPTLDVNGLYSGFIGQGSKTVLPAYAMAKISMRLVPDQDPAEIHQQLVGYLEQNVPDTLRFEVIPIAGNPASISDLNLPAVRALAEALEEVWGVKPVYKREGGSVPIVGMMQRITGFDSVCTGFGLPDDNIHSPNEKLDIPNWKRGIEALIRFIYKL